MSGRAFVDTNVFVYAVDTAEPEKREMARTILAERADDIVVSAQVLAEFYAVTTRRLREPLSEDAAAAYVDDLTEVPVVSTTAQLVRDGIAVSRDAQVSFWDGLIVAAARAGGCDEILTEDMSTGATIAGALIVNPFSK